MKKDNWLSRINIWVLVVIGVLASVISFVYYFVLKNPYEILLWVLYFVDFLLFIVSVYRVINRLDLSKTKTIFFI